MGEQIPSPPPSRSPALPFPTSAFRPQSLFESSRSWSHCGRLFVALLGIAAAGRLSADSPWPQFRGPNGNGIALEASAPVDFEDLGDGTPRGVRWQTTVPGRGWSSPVLADGLIWVTTAIETEASADEIVARKKRSGVKDREMDSRTVAASIDLHLLAFRFEDGEPAMDVKLTSFQDPDAIHALNSYASPTPVIDGDEVYCHFGTYGTFCVDRLRGEIEWKQRTKTVHSVGPGSSPFVEGDRLILVHDGCERQSVIALDKRTGKQVWQTDRPEMDAPDGDRKKAFCTPIAIDDPSGRRQLICMASQYIVSYDPSDGHEIWRCRHGKGFSIVARPVYDDGVVYFTTGFGKAELWAVAVDGEGDVSDTHVRWTVPKGMPQKPSPLIHEGLIYVIADHGVAACLDAEDGSTVWKKRIGGNFSSSPLLVGENLYLGSQEGEMTVLTAGRDPEVVATNRLQGQIMASPAAVAGDLIIRAGNQIYRIGS